MAAEVRHATLIWGGLVKLAYLVGAPLAILIWGMDPIAWLVYASTLVLLQSGSFQREMQRLDRFNERYGGNKPRWNL